MLRHPPLLKPLALLICPKHAKFEQLFALAIALILTSFAQSCICSILDTSFRLRRAVEMLIPTVLSRYPLGIFLFAQAGKNLRQ